MREDRLRKPTNLGRMFAYSTSADTDIPPLPRERFRVKLHDCACFQGLSDRTQTVSSLFDLLICNP